MGKERAKDVEMEGACCVICCFIQISLAWRSEGRAGHSFTKMAWKWEAHTFNPSTREVGTGSDMAGWRKEYKAGGDRSLAHLF